MNVIGVTGPSLLPRRRAPPLPPKELVRTPRRYPGGEPGARNRPKMKEARNAFRIRFPFALLALFPFPLSHRSWLANGPAGRSVRNGSGFNYTHCRSADATF